VPVAAEHPRFWSRGGWHGMTPIRRQELQRWASLPHTWLAGVPPWSRPFVVEAAELGGAQVCLVGDAMCDRLLQGILHRRFGRAQETLPESGMVSAGTVGRRQHRANLSSMECWGSMLIIIKLLSMQPRSAQNLSISNIVTIRALVIYLTKRGDYAPAEALMM
jgi:hypothetical protein